MQYWGYDKLYPVWKSCMLKFSFQFAMVIILDLRKWFTFKSKLFILLPSVCRSSSKQSSNFYVRCSKTTPSSFGRWKFLCKNAAFFSVKSMMCHNKSKAFPKSHLLNYKIHTFWEGHKILRNLYLTFVLCSASQK